MTNKSKNQTDRSLWKNQGTKAFFKTEVMDLRSIKTALLNLYHYEPEPLYINEKYLYV
jgi:hypothetical protein